MKADEEKKTHEAREEQFTRDLRSWQKRHGRRVPLAPARDDRAGSKPWRPGDR